jgi:protein phosphatase
MTPNRPLYVPCLIVLVGPPGSGETTWARRNCYGAVHVSQDELIDAITPGGFDHAYRPVYRAGEDAVARAGLREGQTVIVDRTNRTRVHRERWIRIAHEASVPAVAIVMSTPENVCRGRNRERTGPRRLTGERMRRMLAAFEPVKQDEGFAAVYFNSGLDVGVELDEILSTSPSMEEVNIL